jgi:hypothetical protein
MTKRRANEFEELVAAVHEFAFADGIGRRFPMNLKTSTHQLLLQHG